MLFIPLRHRSFSDNTHSIPIKQAEQTLFIDFFISLYCQGQLSMKTQSKSYALKSCAWCSTSGKWSISIGYQISCLVCGGKGTVSILSPADTCKQCGGNGRRNETNPCLTCAGTGWIHVSD